MKPLVSVIIPCCNQARFLQDAVESVLAQTYPYWECIIINDGSTDDTRSVSQRYAKQDTRFRYVEQENRGVSGARNRGLRETSGGYIQFLDSDDVIAPAKFELQLTALGSSERPALAFCDYLFGAEDDINRTIEDSQFCKPRFRMARPIEDIAARWETEFSIPIHCFLFDARLFLEYGIRFNEQLPNNEDWDCWMRLFARQPQVVHVPEELAIYRRYPSSRSYNLKLMRSGVFMAIDMQLALCNEDPVLIQILERKRAEMGVVYAMHIRAQRLAWWRHLPSRILRVFRRLLGISV